MTHFTDIDSPVTFGRYTATATIDHDSVHGAPWEENDGHGPVTNWTTRDKQPGELILNRVMLAADIGISWADMANFRSN